MDKAQPIFLLSHKMLWRTFKELQEKLVQKDGGPTPVGMDKVLWQMMRDRKIYCWFDPKMQGDMKLGLELPENRPVQVLTTPKSKLAPPKPQEDKQ